jgi:hypothetical protein
MDESVRRVHELWSRGHELLDRRTESALQEAIDILMSVLELVPATGLRASVHHDVSIGHWRLAKLGYPEHVVLAADHALQACHVDVSYMLSKGSTEDLERDVGVLSDVLRLPGIDLARLRAAQSFLDRHRILLHGLRAQSELQQAVAEGYLVSMSDLPLAQGHYDEARRAFELSIELLAAAGKPDTGRLARTLANRSIVELLAAHGVTQFHHALDLAFAVEEAHGDDLAGEPSLRARVILCLYQSRYAELASEDRWRLRFRLWDRWAGDWVRVLNQPQPDPLLRLPLSDWFELLLDIEADDVPLAEEPDADGPIPLEVREYASGLVQFGGYPLGLVVALMGYRLGGREVPLEELFVPEWIDIARDTARMSAMAAFFGRLREAITAANSAGNRPCRTWCPATTRCLRARAARRSLPTSSGAVWNWPGPPRSPDA